MTIEARLHRVLSPEPGPRSALTLLTNGRHGWTADVDTAAGSFDAGPSPHDLLDSALAACTTLTLELYTRRKAFAVTDLRVTVDRIETRAADGRVHYQMQRRIHIDGELSAEDRQRLLEVANKCPLHRLLEGEIRIETSLA